MKKAIFASGCFWGTQYHLQKIDGVIKTTVGYIGGHKFSPTYDEVKAQTTGHAEAVEVEYDPSKVTYDELVILFFETHDPSQTDGQGPDIGDQYRSEIFYFDENQKTISQKYIDILKSKGFNVVTKLSPVETFWSAEDYHQNYYEDRGESPYCHIYTKKF